MMKYPTVFDLIAEEFKKANIPHVLIGGFAVNFYKVTRNTGDLDFLIRKEDFPKAEAILKEAGYEKNEVHEVFARFKGTNQYLLGIDFMFVDSETFQGILKDGTKIRMTGQSFLVPSLDHLIAMKLHALKNNLGMRQYKDIPDIISLAKRNEMDLHAPKFRELCLKYATQEVYQRIVLLSGDS